MTPKFHPLQWIIYSSDLGDYPRFGHIVGGRQDSMGWIYFIAGSSTSSDTLESCREEEIAYFYDGSDWQQHQ